MPNQRTLDFVVLGIARSGTTALAEAINLDPRCFCAHEYFQQRRIDFSKVFVPEAFYDAENSNNNPEKLTRVVAEVKRKLAVTSDLVYGNKEPIHFLIMERLHREIPDAKGLYIYRPAHQIADSWDRRARNEKDRWLPGRTGYFALLEWLIGVSRLAETKQALRLIDYDSFFFDDPALFGRLIEYIQGSAPAAPVIERFKRDLFRGATPPDSPSRAGRFDMFLKNIGGHELDQFMRSRSFSVPSEIRGDLTSFIAARWDHVFVHVIDGINNKGTAAERSFALKWIDRVVKGYDDPGGATFRRMWPWLVDFTETLLPGMSTVERADAAAVARAIRHRLGKDAKTDRLKPLLSAA
ncbi:MAG: sulfotransferase [Alphaproteobacteria bacterium]|nr:sulfotransferase [Alphaproteobacteria bacterium]